MIRRFRTAFALTAIAAGLAVSSIGPGTSAAQEDWVIRSFYATYVIADNGTLSVTEEIAVDFGSLERHGIFRDIPVEYRYDDDSNRLMEITGITVTSGSARVPFETSDEGPNLRIKIGDEEVLVSGQQRYLIRYTVNDGLNPFDDHDELYWNVTGGDWETTIEQASAGVTAPGPGIERITCFQGETGSTDPCLSSFDETSALFETGRALTPGSELTVVVGLRKGLVAVGPPVLVDANEDVFEQAQDMFKLNAATIPVAAVVGGVVLAALGRQWWVAGRDRWFGDMYYIHEDSPPEETKPMFARETVVVEYQPPEVAEGRRLRPAEIGLLLDERADTLDVSATIVHLAVRRHLTIKEIPKGGIFGIFKSQDYELVREPGQPDIQRRSLRGRLRPFEDRLVDALFDSGDTVKLSELKNEFHDDLAKVKSDLYDEAINVLKLFPRNPETVRNTYRVAGVLIAIAGGVLAYALGKWWGAGLTGVPIVAGGVLLFFLAPLMPRRTAQGQLLYRRALGFRLYMTSAETARQEFAEKANLFEEYLPYAIVYGCVKKWAKAFEGLGLEERATNWYVGRRGFAAGVFADSLGDFSDSVSGVMASTPGGSGGSGFGGGGGAGGGGGGGGGGSW
jgi:uncharacterized membrane protein YgcG